jgi:hypothetical protein
MLPAGSLWGLRTTGKLRFARAHPSGRAEGQSPFPVGLGAWLGEHAMRPLRHSAITVQRNAAGSLRARGLEARMETVPTGFVPLYPPYNGVLCPSGNAEGLRPSAFFSIPQDWGSKGVDRILRHLRQFTVTSFPGKE